MSLLSFCERSRLSLGRIELRSLLILYLITLPLQLVTTGSLLEQGSTALIAVTAVHAGAVVALFWSLLANAIVATQIVEDGTLSSLVVRGFFRPLHTAEEVISHCLPATAIPYLYRHYSWCRHLYLTRYSPGCHKCSRWCFKSTRVPTKHRPICANKHLAGLVRFPYFWTPQHLTSFL